jgi:hypothetical protein
MKNEILTLRILYPVWALVGMFSLLYVPSQLINEENILPSIQAIQADGFLFRLGIAGSLVTQLIFIWVAWLLWRVFRGVNEKSAQWMLILALVSVPITLLNEINQLAILQLNENPEQAVFFYQVHKQGILIASIFWGLWLFPLGHLIYLSGQYPKFIGVVVLVAGVGYLGIVIIDLVLVQSKGATMYFEMLTFGEVVWMLWFTVRGPQS